MYKTIDKSNDYYVFVSSKNTHTHIGDKKALIAFLSTKRRFSYWSVNEYFSDINASGNDKKLVAATLEKVIIDEFGDEVKVKETYYYPVSKEYLFYDGYGRIIDVRIFQKEVDKYAKDHQNISYNYNDRKDNFIPGEVYIRGNYRYRSSKLCYAFRRGPVPGTGGYGYYYNYHRQPKIKSIRKQVADPEINSYIRKKSIPFNGLWWDCHPPRHLEKSWKKNKKCRHQWQKNLK